MEYIAPYIYIHAYIYIYTFSAIYCLRKLLGISSVPRIYVAMYNNVQCAIMYSVYCFSCYSCVFYDVIKCILCHYNAYTCCIYIYIHKYTHIYVYIHSSRIFLLTSITSSDYMNENRCSNNRTVQQQIIKIRITNYTY